MNWIASIFTMANQNWTSRIFTLILIGLLTYSATTIFKAKAKVCEDCTVYKEQNKQLISALIDIKKDLQASITTSYNVTQTDGLIFASYDTIPRRYRQYQQAQQRIIRKIDSILYRIKQDSVKQKSKI